MYWSKVCNSFFLYLKFQAILKFLDKEENQGMNILKFLAKLGRRITWNPDLPRYYSNHDYQIFQRILSGEDIFKAPVFEVTILF